MRPGLDEEDVTSVNFRWTCRVESSAVEGGRISSLSEGRTVARVLTEAMSPEEY